MRVLDSLAPDLLNDVNMRNDDCNVAFNPDLHIAEFDNDFLHVNHVAVHHACLISEPIVFCPDQVVCEDLGQTRCISLDSSVAKLVFNTHNLGFVGRFWLIVLYALSPDMG